MKQTRLMMGMPITLEIVDASANDVAFNAVFDYFQSVDQTFSTYKDASEIMPINRHELTLESASWDMQTIFALADQTRQETYGYFDIRHNGTIDPSGIVKGWAIYNAAELLRRLGFENFYVDAGGDIQIVGKNDQGQDWRVGIRNSFNMHEIVKVLSVTDCGVATSGTSIRGQHIHNPKNARQTIDDIVSITVIGPNVYEADRFATVAFAMGKDGIAFIENLHDFEGYMIDVNGIATLTT
ncbi:MAG: FAD:protein FMN transferase [Chloroflexota bacterium]